MWIAFISGWWLGLGSLGHCLGMCGPIALVMPFRGEKGNIRWHLFGSYQIGRISTYVSIGLLVGMLGRVIDWQVPGQWLSIVAGSLLLLVALTYFTSFNLLSGQLFPKLQTFVRSSWSGALTSNHMHRFYLAGMANGLLPCGMVYAAAIAALAMRSSDLSVLLMLGFGLGTLPAFALLPWLSKLLNRYRIYWQKVVPLTLAATGIWLLVRGISPQTHCPSYEIHGHHTGMPMCVER